MLVLDAGFGDEGVGEEVGVRSEVVVGREGGGDWRRQGEGDWRRQGKGGRRWWGWDWEGSGSKDGGGEGCHDCRFARGLGIDRWKARRERGWVLSEAEAIGSFEW